VSLKLLTYVQSWMQCSSSAHRLGVTIEHWVIQPVMREFCEFARRNRRCATKPGFRPTTCRHAGAPREHRCGERIGWKNKHARAGLIRYFITDAFMADDSEPRTNVISDLERIERPVTDDEHDHRREGVSQRAKLVGDPAHPADVRGSGAFGGRALSEHHHEEVQRRWVHPVEWAMRSRSEIDQADPLGAPLPQSESR
jgi:hypothetical protein